jgi:hypothetical protein
MLLAARYNNKIPYRWDLIKKVSSLECTESAFRAAVLHLVSYKFLEIQEVTSDQNPLVQDASTLLAKCSSEERRGEERRDRGEKISVELKLDDDPTSRVFEHWRREFEHPKARLDPKRRKVITAALAAFDEASVCSAISGYKFSPHHMGENDQRTVYDDIELFLRDVTHIERGLNFARAPPKAAKSAVELARERLRNGNGDARVVSEQFGSGDQSLGQVTGLLRRTPAS